MRIIVIFILFLLILFACTKHIGENPNLAYSDAAILDSITAPGSYNYYKNDPTLILPGSHGPHGPFKFRFNKKAFAALTDNGELPNGSKMPDGSLVIKEITSGNAAISLYAFMYKKSGSWIWGEIEPGGNVHYSVSKDPYLCTGCHNQTGNRDWIVTFYFH